MIISVLRFLRPLKYVSNFWRSYEIPFINCEVKLKRRQIKHCVFSLSGTRNGYVNADSNTITATIKDTKVYVPVVTLPEKGNQELSKPVRKGF